METPDKEQSLEADSLPEKKGVKTKKNVGRKKVGKKLTAKERKSLELLYKLDVESYPDGKQSDQELAQRGLQNYDLNLVQLSEPTVVWKLTSNIMLDKYLLPLYVEGDETVELFQHVPVPFPVSKDLIPNLLIERPKLACAAILQGLGFYAATVAPQYSADLFEEEQPTRESSGSIHYGWLKMIEMSSGLPFFRDLTFESKIQLAEQLGRLMGTGKGLPSTQVVIPSTPIALGNCIGFWLASLYNHQGFEDEKLLVELSQAKERFIEYQGFGGEVTILLDWGEVNDAVRELELAEGE